MQTKVFFGMVALSASLEESVGFQSVGLRRLLVMEQSILVNRSTGVR